MLPVKAYFVQCSFFYCYFSGLISILKFVYFKVYLQTKFRFQGGQVISQNLTDGSEAV